DPGCLSRGAGGRTGDVQRTGTVQAAVLEDADVDIGKGLVELDRDRVGRSPGDVLGVVDGLAEVVAPERRRAHLVGVAGAVADRGDVAVAVEPADGHGVEVSGR